MDTRKLAVSERRPKETLKPTKAFSRYKEITPDRLMERIAKLTGIDEYRMRAYVKGEADHERVKAGYGDTLKNPFHGETTIPEAELNVLLSLVRGEVTDMQFSSPLRMLAHGHANTKRLFFEIMKEPQERTNPYPPAVKSLYPWVSFTYQRDGIITIAASLTAFGTTRVLAGEQLARFFAKLAEYGVAQTIMSVALATASVLVLVPSLFHVAKNIILKKTWRTHVEQSYEAVERYGVDGYLAMSLKPWKTLRMAKYLRKLENKGILSAGGFTYNGEQWYAKKVTPAVEDVLQGRVWEV